MQALTRPRKQEGGAWVKLVKSETTFFSLLVSNSSSSLTNSQTVSNRITKTGLFQNYPLTLRLTSRSAVWEEHSARDRT